MGQGRGGSPSTSGTAGSILREAKLARSSRMGGRGAGAGVSKDPVAGAAVEVAWEDDGGLDVVAVAEVEPIAKVEVIADVDGAFDPAGKYFSR